VRPGLGAAWGRKDMEDRYSGVARSRGRAGLALTAGMMALTGLYLALWWYSPSGPGRYADDPLVRLPLPAQDLQVLALCLLLVTWIVQAGTAHDLASALGLDRRWAWAVGAALGWVGWFVVVVLLARATEALRAARRAPTSAAGSPPWRG